MIRISSVSTQPPKYPDSTPMIPPIPIATSVAAPPTSSEVRPPTSTRLKTSMPPSSVPSQCRADGDA